MNPEVSMAGSQEPEVYIWQSYELEVHNHDTKTENGGQILTHATLGMNDYYIMTAFCSVSIAVSNFFFLLSVILGLSSKFSSGNLGLN